MKQLYDVEVYVAKQIVATITVSAEDYESASDEAFQKVNVKIKRNIRKPK